MASKIVPLMPPHCSYIEPFAGSAAVMFKKGLPPHQTNSHHYREVINDLRGDVVAFWRVLQDREQCDDLRHMLRHTLYSKDEFERSRYITRMGDEASTVDRAWAFFVAQAQGFGGAGHYGSNYGRGSWGRGKKVGANLAQTYTKAVDRLDQYVERMRGVYIDSIDAAECIQKWDRPEAFLYVDPPYVGMDCRTYKDFTEKDLARLLDALEGAQGSFILSGYSHPLIEARGWPKVEHDAYSSARRDADKVSGKRTECLWVVDRSGAMPAREAAIARKIWGRNDPKSRPLLEGGGRDTRLPRE